MNGNNMKPSSEWTDARQAIEWIHSLAPFGIKLGLERMEWMLERLGHPERRLKCVHIGGTNGKGSTLSFMAHVLQQAGYTVGTFTSPYLIRFQNRIQINGEDIADEDLLKAAAKIKPLVDELSRTEWGSPTEFEVVTAMALSYFADVAYPDLVLMEVGLGGAADSTNVIVPLVSVITNVGYDHTHILGAHLADIAAEKAGIIKAGVPVVTGVKDPVALDVIKRKANEKRASLYVIDDFFRLHLDQPQTFSFHSVFTHWKELKISLQGDHQAENAGVALMALEILKQYYHVWWEEDDLRRGLAETVWPGRLETVSQHPLTILDGAHNPQGMQALARAIRQYYDAKPVTLVFCTMQDKNTLEMLQPLQGCIDRLILTEIPFPRVKPARDIFDEIKDVVSSGWGIDIRVETNGQAGYRSLAQDVAQENGVLIFAGSLYFIAEVRRHLL